MSKVSVIVPAYNVEPYLPQCLDSIVSQSYANLEIIVVDDGSTDGSGRVADECAARDGRVRVIHKANGGLSDARNAALDAMTGELVMMVDGDDYVSGDCVQTLLALLTQTGSDIAIGDWWLFDDRNDASSAQPQNELTRVYDRDQAISHIFYQDTINHSVCSRLFRASLFERLRFPAGMLYEDLAIAFPLLEQVDRVAHTTRRVYHYRQRASSITGHFDPRRADVLDILEALERQTAQQAPQFLPAVRSRLLSAYFNILLLCPDTAACRPTVDRCWTGIRRLRGGCFRDRNVRLKNKAGIVASLPGRRFVRALFSKH